MSAAGKSGDSVLVDARNPLSHWMVRKDWIAAFLLLLESGTRWFSSHLRICVCLVRRKRELSLKNVWNDASLWFLL